MSSFAKLLSVIKVADYSTPSNARGTMDNLLDVIDILKIYINRVLYIFYKVDMREDEEVDRILKSIPRESLDKEICIVDITASYAQTGISMYKSVVISDEYGYNMIESDGLCIYRMAC